MICTCLCHNDGINFCVKCELDHKITIRTLQEKDLDNGFLETISTFEPDKNISIDIGKAKEIFIELEKNPAYIIHVAEVDGKITSSATLFIEQKFIHGGAKTGHIEDVVTLPSHEHCGLSTKILQSLLEKSKKLGCYKTILDCTDDFVKFYSKEELKFEKVGNEMRINHKHN